MKVITLWQPWASLMAWGFKTIETRHWETKHRGLLGIHAAQKVPFNYLGASRHANVFESALAACVEMRKGQGLSHDFPTGVILCTVSLFDIEPTSAEMDVVSNFNRVFGNFELGRYAWRTTNLVEFKKPIPAKGHQQLWNFDIIADTARMPHR